MMIIVCSTVQHSETPEEAWKKAVVCPASKGGDRLYINNYHLAKYTDICQLMSSR